MSSTVCAASARSSSSTVGTLYTLGLLVKLFKSMRTRMPDFKLSTSDADALATKSCQALTA
eukprot:12163684-Heterocapsa_arctica.AAC.1